MENEIEIWNLAKTMTNPSEFYKQCIQDEYSEDEIIGGLNFFDYKLYDLDKERWQLRNEVTKITEENKDLTDEVFELRKLLKESKDISDKCINPLFDEIDGKLNYKTILKNAEKLQNGFDPVEFEKKLEEEKQKLPY